VKSRIILLIAEKSCRYIGGAKRARGEAAMDLEAAATVLGVHYQTAYRWVRAGVLPAARVGLGYELDREDVEAVREERCRRRPPGGEQSADWWGEGAELVGSLLGGDEAAARQQLERLQAEGATPHTLCEMLVAPALRRLDVERAAGLVLPAEVVVAADLSERLVGAMTGR
jgi:excisionase family DNA binding protein